MIVFTATPPSTELNCAIARSVNSASSNSLPRYCNTIFLVGFLVTFLFVSVFTASAFSFTVFFAAAVFLVVAVFAFAAVFFTVAFAVSAV